MRPVTPAATATQRIVRVRREYNTWVGNETLEDYALRFAPRSFRKWSAGRVAATAFGSVSFLALEAIGGAITIKYGFTNALWAILAVGVIIFLTALPICYYASRNNIDMDLLARGAGFGYIGSTITSLIYASFTFIFFALEAAIMALVFELYFGLPLGLGYLLSSIVIVPMVLYGITFISRFQVWTTIPWALMMIVPFIFIFMREPQLLRDWTSFAGYESDGAGFDALLFAMAATVSFSLIAQIGEQVDFLRFLPEKTAQNKVRWWAAMLTAGPGWIIPGIVKQLAGAFLAFLALQHLVPAQRAEEPTQMYLTAWSYVFHDPQWALAATALFVILSQVKINVTNAYAGSLAWSNFFSRLTHSHPGRVVWLVFNVVIAVLLMELGVFGALTRVLGLYSCVAIAWVGALVADLVINKPLGLSPPFVEFRRAYLYNINPVGVGATLAASVLSMVAFVGVLGQTAQAFSPFIALFTALALAPAIAWATKGKYYIARPRPEPEHLAETCCICGNHFEKEDMAHCPAYAGTICSLCCTLDARCRDMCKKPDAPAADKQAPRELRWAPWMGRWTQTARLRLTGFLLTFALISGVVTVLLWIVYYQQLLALPEPEAAASGALTAMFSKTWATLLVVAGVASWWLVLTRESRRVAEEESTRQTLLLQQEIEDHRQTDAKLQKAKEAAEHANQAKGRFLADMSHELRTPLNSIIGYAQILQNDAAIPPRRRDAVETILQGGEHLLTLIDEILDIARIEAGRFRLLPVTTDLPEFLTQVVNMFRPSAERKGIAFRVRIHDRLPRIVRMDQKRVRQVLINLIGNAVKLTTRGEVAVSIRHTGEIARIDVADTGPGISPQDLERIFHPFQRARNTPHSNDSTGLGLTISRLITEQMGGELTVESVEGQGSTFSLRVSLPPVTGVHDATPLREVVGYRGPRRRLMLVDDKPDHRDVVRNMLQPLGFLTEEAFDGAECIRRIDEFKPDALLIDLVMPGMSGIDVTRVLRGRGWSQPIIAISANVFERDRKETVLAGCNGFVLKPVHRSDLLGQLRLHLSMTWVHASEAVSTSAERTEHAAVPPIIHLLAMRQHARIGYMKGVTEEIERIGALDPVYRPYASRLQELAKQFRTAEIVTLIEESMNHDGA